MLWSEKFTGYFSCKKTCKCCGQYRYTGTYLMSLFFIMMRQTKEFPVMFTITSNDCTVVTAISAGPCSLWIKSIASYSQKKRILRHFLIIKSIGYRYLRFSSLFVVIYRGYYTVARRYEFYFRVT